jgi:hypothetical protein
MKVLELFSGTGSVGNYLKKTFRDVKVISVDLESYKTYTPTYETDILEWNYKNIYETGHFDIIWASPPCVNYSVLQYSWIGRKRLINGKKVVFTKRIMEEKMKESDKIIRKVLEIIDYFKPTYYFIENPYTGNLKNRCILDNDEMKVCDYCMYGKQYRKRTAIWTNRELTLKKCSNNCPSIIKIGKKYTHKKRIGSKHKELNSVRKATTKLERYSIPTLLLKELFNDIIL